MTKTFRFVVGAAVCLLLTSCVSERVDSNGFRRPNAEDNPKFQFPKLEDYKIILEPVTSRRVFYAGEEASMIFRLRNLGKKTLTIPEWRLNEPENIKIFYVPYDKSIKTLQDKHWKCVEPPWHNKRSALVLQPGNSALITKKLTFIKHIDPNKISKDGKLYLVYAELNLTSIKARSIVMKLKIR